VCVCEYGGERGKLSEILTIQILLRPGTPISGKKENENRIVRYVCGTNRK
jgi:hypothetical protein